jgi:hypothetical protein
MRVNVATRLNVASTSPAIKAYFGLWAAIGQAPHAAKTESEEAFADGSGSMSGPRTSSHSYIWPVRRARENL